MTFPQTVADKLLLPVIVGLIPLLLPKWAFKRPWLRWVTAIVLLALGFGITYFTGARQTVHDQVISGTIVDETSSAAIRGAYLTLVGRAESSISESNGNFTLVLSSDTGTDRVHLHVEKDGYVPFDASVTAGVRDFDLLPRI